MNGPLISHIIKQVFAEKDRVYIPGFGTLLRTYIPAKYDDINNRFLPPRYEFELDQSSQYDDPYLIEWLITDQQYTKPQATQMVNEYGEHLKYELSSSGSVQVGEVVQIQKSDGQTVIYPFPDLDYEHYPTIDMDTLWEATESNRGVWWEFSAFISIMLLILVGVYYMVNASRTTTNYPYPSNYPPLIGMIEDSVQTDTGTTNEEYVDLTRDTLPKIDSNTVIIVGSFKNAQNIQAMKSKLRDLGWHVYEENIKKMVRVGVRPEEHENINEVLGLIREEVEEQAWVLKKKN